MKRGLPLSVRIIGIVVILVVASFAVMTVVLIGRVNGGVQANQEHSLTQSVDLAGKFIGSIVGNLSAGSRDLAASLETLDEKGLRAESGRTLLDTERAQEPLFAQLLVLDRDRQLLVASAGPVGAAQLPLLEPDALQARLDQAAAGAVVPGNALRTVPDAPIVFPLARRLRLADGAAATLVCLVDLDRIFAATVASQVYGREGYAFIGDSRGMALSHPTAKTAFTDQTAAVFMQGVLKAIEDKKTAEIIAYPWEGRGKHLAFSLIPGSPFFVAATVWDADLYSLANEIAYTLVLVSSLFIAGIALALVLAIVLLVSRPLGRLAGNLARGADNLESASQQISSSSEQLSSGSSELAASVEEISSSLEELESVVELNTKNINQSELLMRDSNEGAMAVSSRMEVLGGALKEIGDSSNEIVNIIEVIEDIAFQTNILALNAAVEAGRAGEAGKGFSVVADQVKDLAQKSAAASKETSKLIKNALKSIDRGEKLGNEVMDIQKKAAQMSNQVSTLLDEVNRASQEQMKGIKQITIAVNQTNNVVQQTASSAEETAAASEELYSQAEEMNGAVALLTRMISGVARDKDHPGKAASRGRRPDKQRQPAVPDPDEPASPARKGITVAPARLPEASGDQAAAGAATQGRAAPRRRRGNGLPADAKGGFDPEKVIPMNDEFENF